MAENFHQVILVNEADEAIGAMEKMEAHTQGVLHRAFSVFIFNNGDEMLLQQRADDKYHSAGLWTNACCSHPAPGEETKAAASRRLEEEMGFSVPLEEIFSFTYRASFSNGLTEHEYDHVFVGRFDGEVNPDAREVKDFAFKSLDEIGRLLQQEQKTFTAWFVIAFPKIREWMQKQKKSSKPYRP
jgi:isopentenyl-diphosphate delta-isomerase